MKFIVPTEQVDKVQELFRNCGYGNGQVQGDKDGKTTIELYHDQLDTKANMLKYLRDEGINV